MFIATLWSMTRAILPKRKSWIRVGRSPGPFGINRRAAAKYAQQHGTRALVREGYRKVRCTDTRA